MSKPAPVPTASPKPVGDRTPIVRAMLNPKSVAVIGATENLQSVGRTLMENLKSFTGGLYPVNPKRNSVLGLQAFPRIGEVPGPVDLAVIATPAIAVPDLVSECAEAGVQGAVIVSAGFRECGAFGVKLEEAVLARRGIGGDGWGYDIGYGGLDHVLASGRNVKVLLLDTEVYSNTGGQCSKSTPLGAIAKFASAGKRTPKKDLGLIAMSYGNIYVASVAMGAKDEHTLKSFLEAEAYDGPALIIAYSHCIAHGINMTTAMQNQKAAVLSGQWLLYRYNPEQANNAESPLHVDSAAPKLKVEEYFNLENRFKMLSKSRPADAKQLFQEAQKQVDARWQLYQQLARSSSPDKENVKA
jgi:pyruvate/2-oxoacid:ferredoxin oxidoreductase beta subunit